MHGALNIIDCPIYLRFHEALTENFSCHVLKYFSSLLNAVLSIMQGRHLISNLIILLLILF